MVGILSAAISTIDSILLSLSSMCTRDIIKAGINPNISEASEIRTGKRIIPALALFFFVFAYWAQGKTGLSFMIAPLSAAASAGLLMAVPSIIGAFFWEKASAAGALSSMSVGAAVVLILQFSGYKPLGLWPGVWGFILCLLLYVVVSLFTKAPVDKAQAFIGYLKNNLARHNFI